MCYLALDNARRFELFEAGKQTSDTLVCVSTEMNDQLFIKTYVSAFVRKVLD